MKKHIVLIMNIVLILLVIGGIAFTVVRLAADKNVDPAPTAAPTEWMTAFPATSDEAPNEHFKVGVIQHGLDKSSDSCYVGFINQLKKRNLLDCFEIIYVVENDDEKCISEIWRLIEEGCDMLYTIGPFASKYAANATLEIPIVFAAVTDPEEMGLVVSNEAPGGNVTGVSSYTPCFEQIDLIPVLLPEADSVAAIYSSTDESAVRQAIIACKEAEEFRYTADRYPVSDREALRNALSAIQKKGTDVIYLPIDQKITQFIDDIVTFSERNNIPIICGNRKMLEAGCLATCEINYTSIGRRCADLSYDVLFAKKEPATLPVIYKYDCYNFVNLQTLEKLDITLSDVAKKNVEIVDYE